MKRIISYFLSAIIGGVASNEVKTIGDTIQYATEYLAMRHNTVVENTIESANGNWSIDADGWVHCKGLVLDPQPLSNLKTDRGSVMMVESPISINWIDDFGNSHHDDLVPLDELPEGSSAHIIVTFNGVKYAPTGDFSL